MDAIESILSRRSIRRFADEPVGDLEVETLLRCAMAAPSAGDQQVWRFVVLRSDASRRAVAAASPHAGMLVQAPVGIVVCGDTENEKHPGYWVQDCAAAIENLLLAAHALGLGAVWLGYHPVEERVQATQAALGLPPFVRPLGVVAIGHPAERKPVIDRFDEGKTHVDRW